MEVGSNLENKRAGVWGRGGAGDGGEEEKSFFTRRRAPRSPPASRRGGCRLPRPEAEQGPPRGARGARDGLGRQTGRARATERPLSRPRAPLAPGSLAEPHASAPQPTRAGLGKANNASCFPPSLIAVPVQPSRKAHATRVGGRGERGVQTTARLKIPGPCAPRRPGGPMHFSSATPTGGARARRARTLPATSATASPARRRPPPGPRSHTGPGAGVHPAPPGKGPGEWSWRTLAFDPLGNPGRSAAHPQDAQPRAAFFSKTSHLHARPPKPVLSQGTPFAVPTGAGTVPPPPYSTRKTVAPVPESRPLGTPHPARPRTPESHAERTRGMSPNPFPSLVKVESGLCYSRRLASAPPAAATEQARRLALRSTCSRQAAGSRGLGAPFCKPPRAPFSKSSAPNLANSPCQPPGCRRRQAEPPSPPPRGGSQGCRAVPRQELYQVKSFPRAPRRLSPPRAPRAPRSHPAAAAVRLAAPSSRDTRQPDHGVQDAHAPLPPPATLRSTRRCPRALPRPALPPGPSRPPGRGRRSARRAPAGAGAASRGARDAAATAGARGRRGEAGRRGPGAPDPDPQRSSRRSCREERPLPRLLRAAAAAASARRPAAPRSPSPPTPTRGQAPLPRRPPRASLPLSPPPKPPAQRARGEKPRGRDDSRARSAAGGGTGAGAGGGAQSLRVLQAPGLEAGLILELGFPSRSLGLQDTENVSSWRGWCW
ncbi:basic proline-rich protein-like [Dama dama]|uniref:basic proline-rich protein-like n=1 Tax=Dama dama TaxID=30532 RepID=UPI002A35FEED|nr:basic proline-rich protein-like [Dama dama]